MRNRKHKMLCVASLAYVVISDFVGMVLDNWFGWVLVVTGPACMLTYMAWSIRDSKPQDWLPADPHLGRGPDPFLSGGSLSSHAKLPSMQEPTTGGRKTIP